MTCCVFCKVEEREEKRMKTIEMWCRGYKVEKIVDDNEVVHLSEELFDSIIKELNDSIPIEWIMKREKTDNKVLMIEDWKNENEYRKSKNKNM